MNTEYVMLLSKLLYSRSIELYIYFFLTCKIFTREINNYKNWVYFLLSDKVLGLENRPSASWHGQIGTVSVGSKTRFTRGSSPSDCSVEKRLNSDRLQIPELVQLKFLKSKMLFKIFSEECSSLLCQWFLRKHKDLFF